MSALPQRGHGRGPGMLHLCLDMRDFDNCVPSVCQIFVSDTKTCAGASRLLTFYGVLYTSASTTQTAGATRRTSCLATFTAGKALWVASAAGNAEDACNWVLDVRGSAPVRMVELWGS